MKIAIAQINVQIGAFKANTQKMVDQVNQAKSQGADMICFPELAVCGYPPRDFLDFEDFIKLSQQAVDNLKEVSQGIAIIVGAPRKNPEIEGKDLYNAAFVLYDKKVIHVADKALLPTYDIFDEYRYFEPAEEFETFTFKGKKIALTICEDIWNVGNDNPLYKICPMDELSKENPDLAINISASPFSYDHHEKRLNMLRANVSKYKIPFVYVNHIGAQTEVIFDGSSVVMNDNGQVAEQLCSFEEELLICDVNNLSNHITPKIENKIALIHDALILGIRDYFGKLGFTKAILGMSGGIDSAVTAALAAEALGPENVMGLLMPSHYSSGHSVDDAKGLAENLGMPYHIVPIKNIYDSFLHELAPLFKGKPFDVTEENIQARTRGTLLMAMSNKFGHILLNTTNKSEMAVGYGTLYGDLCGGLSIIADVYKMDVFKLARYINRNGEIIPENSITKPPSAELRPDQKDSDSLPDYEILDQVLYAYIEGVKSPDEIEAMGFDPALVARILKMVNRNEFKRYQTAPVLRVSSKAFGMGRRMPIVAKYLN